MANYIGKVTPRTNKFNEQEIDIAFGPKDWEKLGINCTEWKNLRLKYSKEGKPYLVINEWTPGQTAQEPAAQEPAAQAEDDLPF